MSQDRSVSNVAARREHVQVDDLDLYLATQPEAVQHAADDAEEYFRLVRSMRAMRKDLRVKQRVVARAMGTTQSAVSELENFRTDPQISTLMRYARAIGARVRLLAAVEDSVRLEGPDAWRHSMRQPSVSTKVSKGHLRSVATDAANWRVPA